MVDHDANEERAREHMSEQRSADSEASKEASESTGAVGEKFVHFRSQRNCPDVRPTRRGPFRVTALPTKRRHNFVLSAHPIFPSCRAKRIDRRARTLRNHRPLPPYIASFSIRRCDHRWMRRLHANVKRYIVGHARRTKARRTTTPSVWLIDCIAKSDYEVGGRRGRQRARTVCGAKNGGCLEQPEARSAVVRSGKVAAAFYRTGRAIGGQSFHEYTLTEPVICNHRPQ
uniref:Uncharacterized protein n=1 Tax=Plectus sambesii TaxID=2011161 RepID=A0A914UYE1_9BILA